MSNFMKICLVGAEFDAERGTGGQIDRQGEANSRFSQFCERVLKEVGKSVNKVISFEEIKYVFM